MSDGLKFRFEIPNIPLFDINKAREVMSDEIENMLDLSAEHVVSSVQKEAPQGVTGRLRDSIQVRRSKFERIISPEVKYAIIVEKGRKAGPTPFRPLVNWVRLSLKGRAYFARLKATYPNITAVGAAVVLAKSMKKKARKAQKFFEKGVEASATKVSQEFDLLLKKIAEKLA